MIRGTNHEQDARFQDKTKRMLEKSNWPEKYDIKIDLKKVDYELIKIWIEKKLTSLLGEEDDITSGTLISIMDEHLEKQQKLNAKKLHIAISGFLQQKTLLFMSELWDVLDEAQKSARGIPECLIEEKMKNEEKHRRTLDQLDKKRHKINSNYFNNLVKTSRGKFDYKKEKGDVAKQSRDNEDEHKKSKKHRRSRSKDRSKNKKHRSRSRSRNNNQKSKDRKELRKKHRRHSYSSEQAPQKVQKHKKSEKKRRSEESDSSGVVSSSDSDS